MVYRPVIYLASSVVDVQKDFTTARHAELLVFVPGGTEKREGGWGSGRELGPLVPPPDGDEARVEIHPRIEDSRQARFPVLALPLQRKAFLESHLRLDW